MGRLTTRLYRYIVQPVLYGIGYFFGFSLIIIFSIGLILPGPYDEIYSKAHNRPAWKIIYKEHQKLFVVPELVVAIGWAFAILLIAIGFAMTR